MSEGGEIFLIWIFVMAFTFVIALCDQACRNEEITEGNNDDEWETVTSESETPKSQKRNTILDLRTENERLRTALNKASTVPNPQYVGWCPPGSNPKPNSSIESQCPYPMQMPLPSQLPYPAQMPYPSVQSTAPYPSTENYFHPGINPIMPTLPYPSSTTSGTITAPYPLRTSSEALSVPYPSAPYAPQLNIGIGKPNESAEKNQTTAPYQSSLPSASYPQLSSDRNSSKPTAPYPIETASEKSTVPYSPALVSTSVPQPATSQPPSLKEDLPLNFDESMKLLGK